MILLPCDHGFCKACFLSWTKTNRSCPVCQKEYQSYQHGPGVPRPPWRTDASQHTIARETARDDQWPVETVRKSGDDQCSVCFKAEADGVLQKTIIEALIQSDIDGQHPAVQTLMPMLQTALANPASLQRTLYRCKAAGCGTLFHLGCHLEWAQQAFARAIHMEDGTVNVENVQCPFDQWHGVCDELRGWYCAGCVATSTAQEMAQGVKYSQQWLRSRVQHGERPISDVLPELRDCLARLANMHIVGVHNKMRRLHALWMLRRLVKPSHRADFLSDDHHADTSDQHDVLRVVRWFERWPTCRSQWWIQWLETTPELVRPWKASRPYFLGFCELDPHLAAIERCCSDESAFIETLKSLLAASPALRAERVGSMAPATTQ